MSRKNFHPLVLLIIAIAFVGTGCLAGIGMKLLLRSTGLLDTLPGRGFQTLFFILSTTLFYKLYLKKFEHSSLWEYATHHWFRKVLLGMAIGSGLIAIQVAFLALLGHYHITAFQPSPDIVKYIFLMLLVGFLEELLTRGVIFRLVEKWAGSLIALLVVALEGGLTHATNPNSSLLSSVAVGLEFGILMTLVYMVTRNLWVVSALHFAWNFTMGGIFNIAVSGTDPQSLFGATIEGPTYLTGGAFGIEAGTPAIVLTIISSVVIVRHLLKTDGFKPPSWSKYVKNKQNSSASCSSANSRMR